MPNKKIKERQQKLVKLTQSFCENKLDDEYALLCEKLINKMGRKREVPFKRGQLDIWAASIVHALGTINFLFDKSFEPYATVADIHEYFGTKKSTVSQKSKKIRDMFDLWHFDDDFSVASMKESNPLNKMVMVDGFIVPLDTLPLEQQEMVKQARAEGRDIQFYTDR